VGSGFECFALPAELYPHVLLGTSVIIANLLVNVNPFFKKTLEIFVFIFFVQGLQKIRFVYIMYLVIVRKEGDSSWRTILFLLDGVF